MHLRLRLSQERGAYGFVDVTGTGSYADRAGNTGAVEVDGLNFGSPPSVMLNISCGLGVTTCVARGQFWGDWEGANVINGVFSDFAPPHDKRPMQLLRN